MRPARLVVALSLIALPTALFGCLHTPPPPPRALYNNELCDQQLKLGDLEQAETYCNLGLEFAPQYGDLWVNKGIIQLRRGQIPEAKEAFIKAIRYNPDQAQAYNNLGYIYLEHEQEYGKARDNFQRALKVNPDYTEARYNLSIAFRRMKDFERSREALRTILAINPTLADPHHDLCLMELEEGKLNEAIAHCSKAVQLEPSFDRAWLTLGVAFLEAGRCPEAPQAFESCIDANPESVECRHNLPLANDKCALSRPVEGASSSP